MKLKMKHPVFPHITQSSYKRSLTMIFHGCAVLLVRIDHFPVYECTLPTEI